MNLKGMTPWLENGRDILWRTNSFFPGEVIWRGSSNPLGRKDSGHISQQKTTTLATTVPLPRPILLPVAIISSTNCSIITNIFHALLNRDKLLEVVFICQKQSQSTGPYHPTKRRVFCQLRFSITRSATLILPHYLLLYFDTLKYCCTTRLPCASESWPRHYLQHIVLI